MELLDAIILGIVEGITEFLPVSSTGHLMLASQLLGIENIEFAKSFDIIIQLGAILAVVVLYPRRLITDKETIARVASAFVPTAAVGLLAYPLIKSHLLGDLTILLLALALGGVAIILLEQYWRPPENKTIRDLSLFDSAKIGLLQTVAFIPGVSRSAMTIFGGMWMGLSRKESVEFSFFVAVPTMAAATGLDILKNYEMLFASEHLLALLVGFIASFVTAMAAIALLLRFVATNDFKLFGVYRIILALIFAWVFFF
jgi:undecaprenyl-diphosphatase